MNNVQFVKSFSRGQITIPKVIRDSLGITEDFWLKLIVSEGKIIAEPIREEKQTDNQEYLRMLLNMRGSWDVTEELEQGRKDIEERMKKNVL